MYPAKKSFNLVKDWEKKLNRSIHEKPSNLNKTLRKKTDNPYQKTELSKEKTSMKNLPTQ